MYHELGKTNGQLGHGLDVHFFSHGTRREMGAPAGGWAYIGNNNRACVVFILGTGQIRPISIINSFTGGV